VAEVIAATEHGSGEARAWCYKPQDSTWPQYFTVVVVVVGISLPAMLLRPVLGPRVVALLFLLGVVLLGLLVGRGPILLAALLSAVCWDFFLVDPVTQLRIRNPEDAMMFGVYLVVALVLGQLTSRIRVQEQIEREREAHATSLYSLTRELVWAQGLNDLLEKTSRQFQSMFQARVAFLLSDGSGRNHLQPHPASTYDPAGPEQPVATWVLEQGQPAGKFAAHFPLSETLFLPLATGEAILGVLGVSFDPSVRGLTLQQRRLLQAFCEQIAVALDRQRLREESEKNKLLAESERLSQALLNSISHEIRTPLAAIGGGLENLIDLDGPKLSAEQHALLDEVQQAVQRLNRLVGKILDVTRVESGTIKPRFAWCDVRDLVQVAVGETRSELSRHKLEMDLAPDLPLVLLDFVLVQEALKNLLSNAALHTPRGTTVRINARVSQGALLLSVADRGPGIAAECLPRIFHKFYRAPGAPTGGTGLGLSVVKGFIDAHGGEVKVENHFGGGALFTIRLPLRQTSADELMSERNSGTDAPCRR
jgi:two-component system sensor histidine kinase KdpD